MITALIVHQAITKVQTFQNSWKISYMLIKTENREQWQLIIFGKIPFQFIFCFVLYVDAMTILFVFSYNNNMKELSSFSRSVYDDRYSALFCCGSNNSNMHNNERSCGQLASRWFFFSFTQLRHEKPKRYMRHHHRQQQRSTTANYIYVQYSRLSAMFLSVGLCVCLSVPVHVCTYSCSSPHSDECVRTNSPAKVNNIIHVSRNVHEKQHEQNWQRKLKECVSGSNQIRLKGEVDCMCSN